MMSSVVVVASLSSWLQSHVLNGHGAAVYTVVGLAAFLEVAIIVGFFIPGEIAAIVGGVAAGQPHAGVNVWVMVAVVAAASSIGNLCGFELGSTVGPWLRTHRPLRNSAGVLRAEQLIARRGGAAVFIGRFVVVVRAIIPGIAGISDMRRRTFVLYATTGAVVWSVLWVVVGWQVGLDYTRIVNDVGRWGIVIVAAAAVVLLGWHLVRHRRAHRASPT
ncbi:MAG: DedA family protein [Acidimicrobiales bacterium]